MKDIDNIILEVINGEASTESLDILHEWINESPDHELIYQEILNYWYEDSRPDSARVRRILAKVTNESLQQEMPFTPIQGQGQMPVPVLSPSRKFRYPVAAVFALLFASIGGWYLVTQYFGGVNISTSFSQTREVTLPDQSKVILNANSGISYKKNNPREVWLKGEAFFEVSKKPLTGENFLVHTEDLTIEVLGTAFNVNSHQEETRVFLEEGKIKLALQGKEDQEVILTPGDYITYSQKKGGALQKTRSEANLHTSWKQGSIIWDMKPLSEVLEKFEEVYGVLITVEDSLLLKKEVRLAVPIEDFDIAISALENVLGSETKHIKDNEFIFLRNPENR